MKIGILSYRSHPFSGGQGVYVKHLSYALALLGHEVSVLSGPPYPETGEEIDLIKIESLDLFSSSNRLSEFKLRFLLNKPNLIEWFGILTGGFPEPLTFGMRVEKYLKENTGKKFDILLDNQSLSYSLLRLQKQIPLAATIHHPISMDHKIEIESSKTWQERLSSNRWHSFLKMQMHVARRLDNIIAVSQSSKSDIVREFNVDQDNIRVILNGVDIETFKASLNRKIVNGRLVTTASADVPLKGLKFLVEALPEIISKKPNAHLMVIGKKPHRSDLIERVNILGLQDKIHFNSNLSQEDIVNIYSSAEIAIIPSLYEGFGFGAAEAMSCSVPLISTTSGGLKEVIGDSAYIIKAGSVSEIKDAVLFLFSNQKKKEELSFKGRNRIETNFTWEKAALKYVDIFNRIIRDFKN